MNQLDLSSITLFQHKEDKDSLKQSDTLIPIQPRKLRSFNQLRNKKVCHSIQSKKKDQEVSICSNDRFAQFPKSFEQKHSFKSIMEQYFQQLNQKKKKPRQNSEKTTRMRNYSNYIDVSNLKNPKKSGNEILIQDFSNNSNRQIKLSDMCKDIMIYNPLKNQSSYFPKLKFHFHIK
ncbi:unnamed protein product [Paramecium sonneborni]|uniref:Uncharacterized protein n=1 Tax=Paramecium sonneborni TaxID=65129 RepID=A0A8S1NNR2_9CILI|nr:unnamed protein product [Paramecium sonneborni]